MNPGAVRNYAAVGLSAALTLSLDQWTKMLARQALEPRGPLRPQVIVDGYLDLRYGENPGGAFNLLQDVPGGGLLFALLAVATVGLVVAYLRKTGSASLWPRVALGLVAGGAAGNFIDRVRYGVITDFVVLKIGYHPWPSFNLADLALCAGVGLFALYLIFARPEATDLRR
jgi:signal peptidase II